MTLSHFISIHCATLALCTAITLSSSDARSERVSTANVEKAESTKTPSQKSSSSSATEISIPATTIKAETSTAVAKPEINSLGKIDISQGFSHVAEPALPSVVNIATTQIIDPKAKGERPQIPSGTPFDELFREFFDHQQFDAPRKVQSLGSGFIIRVTTDAAYMIKLNWKQWYMQRMNVQTLLYLK